jgi:hypothetical protein
VTEPSSAPDLNETSKTETTVRQFDADGRVTAETVVTTVVRKECRPDLPTGMYL